MQNSLSWAGLFFGKHKSIIGISLKAEACTEHEIPITELKDSLGVGLGDHPLQITDHSKVTILERGTETYLTMNNKAPFIMFYPKSFSIEEKLPKIQVAGAWDEFSCVVSAKHKESREFLRKMYEAFQQNDIMISRRRLPGENGPFHSPSLNILIKSAMPYHLMNQFFHKPQPVK